ncbi:O-methyltransferase [Sporosarcina gallistercoris]|uniref:tRNA 5-hydroxyuridine methyltransferase n=1 Tax=Sporosarcina gallistercoris TaxID=2762245 RepID=A0ABR8PFF4_9BACL|nr:O-methyltransferase [Sporosarcina gallistercoris]MBD7906896.1 O-methyltransferase [Sporosarcina gallistercoris]
MTNYETYRVNFEKEVHPLVKEMEKYAEEQFVPIMDRIGIETFIGLLSIQNPATLLEIGSAIGYSAIRLAQANPELHIATIERDEERHAKAVHYIERAKLNERISLFKDDALTFDTTLLPYDCFDACFIDAAKGQYKRFFDKYEPLVKTGGIIYCDNMFMHGLVFLEDQDIPRRSRTMIRNLKAFTEWIMENPAYETSLLPVGDGILIARKNS